MQKMLQTSKSGSKLETDCSKPYGYVKMTLGFDGKKPEDIPNVSAVCYLCVYMPWYVPSMYTRVNVWRLDLALRANHQRENFRECCMFVCNHQWCCICVCVYVRAFINKTRPDIGACRCWCGWCMYLCMYVCVYWKLLRISEARQHPRRFLCMCVYALRTCKRFMHIIALRLLCIHTQQLLCMHTKHMTWHAVDVHNHILLCHQHAWWCM